MSKCGYPKYETPNPNDMLSYYSAERQSLCGVVRYRVRIFSRGLKIQVVEYKNGGKFLETAISLRFIVKIKSRIEYIKNARQDLIAEQ